MTKLDYIVDLLATNWCTAECEKCPFGMEHEECVLVIDAEEEAKAAAEKVKALLLSLHEPEDGNSQKTPIPESLQQEDCKKRTFVRPSHETPDHYRLNPEPIAVIKAWDLGFCLGNVIKYIARAGHKAGESRDSDLHKAMEYLRMELEDQANEVYEAYKKKNAVNRQRIEEGY